MSNAHESKPVYHQDKHGRWVDDAGRYATFERVFAKPKPTRKVDRRTRTSKQAYELMKQGNSLTYEQACELTRGDIILELYPIREGVWGMRRHVILRTYTSKRWHWVKLYVFGLDAIQVWRSKPHINLFLGVTSNRHA